MPIHVNCQCGKSYNFKDEFAGRKLKCSQCGVNLQVGSAPSTQTAIDRPSPSDPVFRQDKFLLRQKVWTIAQKYDICDEQGNPILYIERPAHLLRNIAAILSGVSAGLMAGFFLFVLSDLMGKSMGAFLFAILGILSLFVVSCIVATTLSTKRHITIYKDKSKQEPLLKVLPDKKFEFLTSTFTLRDTNRDLAKFRKNYLYDLFRKQWHCYAPDGTLICLAKELRTNFILIQGGSDRVIGEFNQKFTILDRYVLDMSADSQYYLDRKIAIALGVMLDTGEWR